VKARTHELLDRSVSAMLGAIELYNKPQFPYRCESFAVLAINAWELLLKARWLQLHGNKVSSLYQKALRKNKNGETGKRFEVRKSGGVPMTHALEFLLKQLLMKKEIEQPVYDNLGILQQFRNTSVHFLLKSFDVAQRLQEIGMASVKNYSTLVQQWFNQALSDFDFFLMPLALINPPVEYRHDKSVVEKQFLDYLAKMGIGRATPNSKFAVAINVEVKFSRVKDGVATPVQISKDPSAVKVTLTDDQFTSRYPYTYKEIVEKLKKKYPDFKQGKDFMWIKRRLEQDQRLVGRRYLNPKKKSGIPMKWYSEAFLSEFNIYYKQV